MLLFSHFAGTDEKQNCIFCCDQTERFRWSQLCQTDPLTVTSENYNDKWAQHKAWNAIFRMST